MENSLVNTNLVSEQVLNGEYTVTALTIMIRKTVEGEFSGVLVVGEVSGYKLASSGHVYFTLKDEQNLIACVCWNSAFRKINFDLADGMSISVKGTVTVYGGQSKYQINVTNIKPLGAGRLMQLFQELKLRLAQEGLFDQIHKKSLPFWPKIVAVVTSPQGAVFWDIMHRVRDRFPTFVLLYPVAVQGSAAAAEIEKAIGLLNDPNYMQDLLPDVIIIARGGGSIEDLWTFNEESVVRCVFNSKIPIVSAIGHETDFTLMDFVADVRAPTPTAAAEFVLPSMAELKNRLTSLTVRLANLCIKYLSQNTKLLRAYSRPDKSLVALLRNKEQRFDDLDQRTRSYNLRNYFEYLARNRLKIEFVTNLIARESLFFQNFSKTLSRLAFQYLENCRKNLHFSVLQMQKLDINRVLKRGFVLVKSENQLLRSVKHIKIDEMMVLEFYDGKIVAQVKGLLP